MIQKMTRKLGYLLDHFHAYTVARSFIAPERSNCVKSVRDFDEKTRQKETRWKHQQSWWLIPLLTASFIMKIEQIILFKGFPRLNFNKKKQHVLENGLNNSCTKNQVTPMVSFLNIKDLKLKMKILCAVKWTKKQYIFNLIVMQIYNPFVLRPRMS